VRFPLWRRKRRNEELDEEIQGHLTLAEREQMESGQIRREAQLAARHEFGNVGLAAEVTRDMWGWRWLADMLQDARYGLRMLRKNPGFTAVAVLTLALGIGATTVIYAVAYTVMLKPLPFPNPDRLMTIWEAGTGPSSSTDDPSPGDYNDWRKQSSSFEQIAAIVDRSYNLTGAGDPEELHGEAVSGNLFSMLEVPPVLGRVLTPVDDHPSPDVAVLSYGLWRRRFASDPAVVGKSVLLDNVPTLIVGVVPASVQLGDKTDEVWTPLGFTNQQAADRRSHFLSVIGRLRSGITPSQAQAEMDTIAKLLGSLYPQTNAQSRVRLVPLQRQLVGDARTTLLTLLVAVALVLVMACANVANLLLARAASRHKEIALREALGASRNRLLRQLFTESLILALLGAILGVALANWSAGLWRIFVPLLIPNAGEVRISGTVLGFAAALCLLAALSSGVAPALQLARADSGRWLAEGGKSSSGGIRKAVRKALVVSEIAIAFTLLIGAGLLLHSFVRLQEVDTGFQSDHVLALRVSLPRTKYAAAARRAAFYDQLLERVDAIPGVRSASVITFLPLTFPGGNMPVTAQNQPVAPGGELPLAAYRLIGADYFRALGIALKQGKYFDAADMADTSSSAIINETMARRVWPDGNPIGQHFKLAPPDSQSPWLTVSGVVADVRQFSLQSPAALEVYVPYTRNSIFFFAPRDLVVRTGGDPLRAAAALRSAIWSVDSEQPVSEIRTMEEIESASISQPRFDVLVVGFFAIAALMLGAIGIYGVMAYTTTQRRQEIGVRLALGATRLDILRLVLHGALELTVFGAAIGVAMALVTAQFIRSLLYNVSTADTLTYVTVFALLFSVSMIASLVPALRATRVDPLVALRYE
jgi:putative ABC transport system permease protein